MNDKFPDARSFDDEGVPCKYFPIVENGVLKNFYYDLYYANKMNVNSTGHGYKSGERDLIRATSSPSLGHFL